MTPRTRHGVRFALLLALLQPLVISAAVDPYPFSSEVEEVRFRSLIAELRCLVCQNQNLADSDAELAQDLRQQVYQMILRGESDQSIIAFMVERYGDFVLYRPPVKGTTALLWAGPFILMLLGLVVLVRTVRRHAPDGPSGHRTEPGTHREEPEEADTP
jgi:cytochrome c-type biogenesis protein CcmH